MNTSVILLIPITILISVILDAMRDRWLPKRCEGEAALYGPKLDFMFRDSLGKEVQIPTVQIDFATPKRFSLVYTNKDGKEEHPVCKIIRSVYWVDNPPDRLGSPRRLLEYLAFITFLSDKAMVRIGLFNSIHDYLLASGIGLGYHLIVVLH